MDDLLFVLQMSWKNEWWIPFLFKSFNGLITLLVTSVHCGLNDLSLILLSRHKGVVTNIIEGTTSLAVTLDDGKVKTLELGKQGVRFVPQKQKRSRTWGPSSFSFSVYFVWRLSSNFKAEEAVLHSPRPQEVQSFVLLVACCTADDIRSARVYSSS